jgi:hypothetical protein
MLRTTTFSIDLRLALEPDLGFSNQFQVICFICKELPPAYDFVVLKNIIYELGPVYIFLIKRRHVGLITVGNRLHKFFHGNIGPGPKNIKYFHLIYPPKTE